MQQSIATVLLCALFVTARRCQNGWFTSPVSRDLCFKFINSRANFFLASDACQRLNSEANLATISNVFENAALRAFALNFAKKSLAWIGLIGVAENNLWSWINGHGYLTFSKWAPGYPNETEPNSLCVAMNSTSGLWVNKDCATTLPFFCSIGFIDDDVITTIMNSTS
uniref:C-type lectin domain-containing protein n=1 Tax=Parascaris univalens TaxID=6257 RepID=A0A915BPB5_PARUN